MKVHRRQTPRLTEGSQPQMNVSQHQIFLRPSFPPSSNEQVVFQNKSSVRLQSLEGKKMSVNSDPKVLISEPCVQVSESWCK